MWKYNEETVCLSAFEQINTYVVLHFWYGPVYTQTAPFRLFFSRATATGLSGWMVGRLLSLPSPNRDFTYTGLQAESSRFRRSVTWSYFSLFLYYFLPHFAVFNLRFQRLSSSYTNPSGPIWLHMCSVGLMGTYCAIMKPVRMTNISF